MDTNIVRDITEIYFNQIAGQQLEEQVVSEETNKPANVTVDRTTVKKRARNIQRIRDNKATLKALEKHARLQKQGLADEIELEGEMVDEVTDLYGGPREASKIEAREKLFKQQNQQNTPAVKLSDYLPVRQAKKEAKPTKTTTQVAHYEPEGDLVDEAKVDKELPEHERATARDNRSGHNLPGSGTRRVRRAEHEARRGKPKRWWDDDGDGIGWENGEVRKEAKEVKKWFDDDEDDIGYEPGEVSGRFRRKRKIIQTAKSTKYTSSKTFRLLTSSSSQERSKAY